MLLISKENRILANHRLCFAKILCALKIERFPAPRLPHPGYTFIPERQEFLPKAHPRDIPIYIDGGTFVSLRAVPENCRTYEPNTKHFLLATSAPRETDKSLPVRKKANRGGGNRTPIRRLKRPSI